MNNTSTRQDFVYFDSIRVRYSEIDAQGIVFNAHYLTYFDVALNEFLRYIDFDYHEMVRELDLDFHLVKSEVEYLGPLHFDDILNIGVRASRIGNSSITWDLGVFKKGDEKCYALGKIIWVCTKVGSHQSHSLPENLLEKIKSQPHITAD